MLERIDRLVFYFNVDCANCHNLMKVSHVTVEEGQGNIVCTLCGKKVVVPNFEVLVKAAKDLNAYLGDSMNHKRIKLSLNEQFKVEEAQLAAH